MGAFFLLAFGLLTIGLGWLQLHNTLYGPFVLRPGETPAKVRYADEKTKLQQIDTDHDGLNDYEELNFYQTSPYLPDTDSDGISDKDEIDRGSDPLCVEGQSCSAAGEESPAPDPALPVSPILENVEGAADILSGLPAAAAPAFDMDTLASDPRALRELIMKTGKMKAEELEKIDDATLLSIAKELVSSP